MRLLYTAVWLYDQWTKQTNHFFSNRKCKSSIYTTNKIAM